MRLLLDQNLSPLLAEELVARGHDAVHVCSLGMSTASERMIMDSVSTEARVVVSADTDFGSSSLRPTQRRRPCCCCADRTTDEQPRWPNCSC